MEQESSTNAQINFKDDNLSDIILQKSNSLCLHYLLPDIISTLKNHATLKNLIPTYPTNPIFNNPISSQWTIRDEGDAFIG